MSGEANFLTIAEVAGHIRMAPDFVRKLVKQDELYLEADGTIRREVLDNYINSCRADTAVYFIQMEQSRHVKIGIAWDPQKRLNELQTGNPEKLTLVAFTVVVNGRALEKRLHRALSQYRLQGEWFRAGPWLDALAAHAKRGPGMSEQTMRKMLL